MKKNKYLYIHLVIQDGERRHDHKVLHITRASNLAFAAERYVSTFWGYGKADKESKWWDYGECSGKLKTYQELTKREFNFLNKFL